MDVDLQQRQVLNLFERVTKPFTPNDNITYDTFDLSSRKKVPQGEDEAINFNDEEPPISTILISDSDLALISMVPRGSLFSNFHPRQREAAYALTRIFKSVATVKEMIDLAASIRDEVNEHVFVFAWSAALIQRPDARSLRAPPIWEVFPDKFVECTVVGKARTIIKNGTHTLQDKPLIINRNFTATDREPENKLSYFREDMGINSHHWHWHLIYPVEGENPRDRRGELFYYMHQQILARYDAERIANGLARVASFHDWNQPIFEAYFPKLSTANGAINWGSRPSGLVLKDINIPDEGSELGIQFQIQDLERWRTRILNAIHSGTVEGEDGQPIALDEKTGTNILGELIEASDWSANKLLYGDMHNFGHYAMCYVHDPDRSHSENMGVMGDSVTAMRDPIFYRWHKFVDSLFQQFKATLQPYTSADLINSNITLESIAVHKNEDDSAPQNVINTGWQESDVELSRGLDFSSPHPVQARVTHIQHQDFYYHIGVTNSSDTSQEVVFRIFMGPNQDGSGRKLPLREQQLLMIEMDKFVAKVEPGSSVVKRSSNDSSVTIPFERTFRELESPSSITPLAPGGVPTDQPTDALTNFCGCGWPDHFLVPRGQPQPGMPFTLFVMATNWEEDRVVNETSGATDDSRQLCRNAASYCGILDEKYPDLKPMGFPFDRPPARKTTTLDQFVGLSPNMTSTAIRIVFEDRVISRYP